MKLLYDISNSEIDHLISEWIHNERNRRILHDRLIDGLIFERLAEKYDMSVQHIKSIVYRGSAAIFSHYDRHR